MGKAAELLKQYVDLREEISAEALAQQVAHSQADKKVADIQHEIEFGQPDVCTMVHIFKDLQATLRERRTVKDEIHVLNCTLQLMGNKTDKLVKAANGEINRHYTPRVLTDLDFSNAKVLLKSRKSLILAA